MTATGRWPLHVAAIALVWLSVAACGVPQHATTIAVSASPSPGAPAGYPPTGGPAPDALQGSWKMADDPDGPSNRLIISAHEFRESIGHWHGSLVVNGNELDVFDSAACALTDGPASVDGIPHPYAVGRYTWTMTGSVVHFEPLNDDPCQRRIVFTHTTFTRA